MNEPTQSSPPPEPDLPGEAAAAPGQRGPAEPAQRAGPSTAAAGVSRLARVLDLAGVLLFALGGGVYVFAWAGMRELEGAMSAPVAPPFAHFQRYSWLWDVSRVGLLVAVAGVAVILFASALARRQRGAAASPGPE